jgi:hypothetical protein
MNGPGNGIEDLANARKCPEEGGSDFDTPEIAGRENKPSGFAPSERCDFPATIP